jgi:hypothetical protein
MFLGWYAFINWQLSVRVKQLDQANSEQSSRIEAIEKLLRGENPVKK